MDKLYSYPNIKKNSRVKDHLSKYMIVYVFLIPIMIHFTIFFLAPILFSFIITFFDWPIVGTPEFVGIGNWQNLLHDSLAWKSIKNTLLFSLYFIIPTMALGLLLANLLQNLKGKVQTFFKGVFFLPVVTSFVVIASIWAWVFKGTDSGIINQMLHLFGIDPQLFLSSSHQALIVLAGLSILKVSGSTMIYYFAGLQGIPKELYEAADIDGASKRKQFWKITFPLLVPIHFYVAITTTISSFQIFDSAYLLTAGGPNYSTNTIVYYMYQEGFTNLRLGYASVLAYVVFIMVFAISMIQKKFLGKNVEYM